jgi:hypothetical protein
MLSESCPADSERREVVDDAVIVPTAPKVERLSRHSRKWFGFPGLLTHPTTMDPRAIRRFFSEGAIVGTALSLYPLFW